MRNHLIFRRLPFDLVVALFGVVFATEAAGDFSIREPATRGDRLVTVYGERHADLLAEFYTPKTSEWLPATVYVGATVDEWRTQDHMVQNTAIVAGNVPKGAEPCLWNYFFDVEPPQDPVRFRLRSAVQDRVMFETKIDLGGAPGALCLHAEDMIGSGAPPPPWKIAPGSHQHPSRNNLCLPFTREIVKPDDRYPIYHYEEAAATPIVLSPRLEGWHRIYVGSEDQTSFRLSLSGEGIKYPVPEYLERDSRPRLLQDYHVTTADLSGQQVVLEPGGARYWKDVSIRYVRFVPMTEEEITAEREARHWATAKGRPFAAYAEPFTICWYEPRTITLQDHLRNEMRLHRKRGCTDVYVHAIRLGSQAWYHSDVVERFLPKDDTGPDGPSQKWCAWMEQGDPMQVAIEEGRTAGLRVLADMGMNVSYVDWRERLIREHPEFLLGGKGIFLDYRKPKVRDCAVAVATELLTKYDVDGIHLDYARFGANTAFDTQSLIDVGRRVHAAREEAETKWGHPVLIAARIPSYRYHWKKSAHYTGNYPEFIKALKTWSQNGWIDRVMACSMAHADYLTGLDITRYAEAVQGTKTLLWGDLYGGGSFGGTSTATWRKIASKWGRQGLNGGFFFYTTERPTEFQQLDWQLRLTDFPAKAAVFSR